MKVISIGTDRNIFKKESAVRARVTEYGALFEELHIVVFSRRALGHKKEQISSNVWIYPTNSLLKIFYIKNAFSICVEILRDKRLTSANTVTTCQDPFETGIVGMKLKKKFDIPLHIQIHTDLFSPFFRYSSVLNWVRVHIAKKVLVKANAVRVVSKRIADSLVAQKSLTIAPMILSIFVDKEKIENTPITTDLKKKYPKWNFIIFMASRLTKEKNIPLAINVMQKLLLEYPSIGLVIVGSGTQEKNLRALVLHTKLSNNVVFESWQNDLVSYYKTADLFLVTSDYEGFGMTIVEALFAHCPTISTDVGIASDVLKDRVSFVCPVGDGECLLQKIKIFIKDNQLRETFTHEAVQRLASITDSSRAEYLQKYKASIEMAHEKVQKFL